MPKPALCTPAQASRLNSVPGVSMLPVWLSYSLSSRKIAFRPLSPMPRVPVRPQRLPLNQATRGEFRVSPAALALLVWT